MNLRLDFLQIDSKLNNMMDYMSNFIKSINVNAPPQSLIGYMQERTHPSVSPMGRSLDENLPQNDYEQFKPMNLPPRREPHRERSTAPIGEGLQNITLQNQNQNQSRRHRITTDQSEDRRTVDWQSIGQGLINRAPAVDNLFPPQSESANMQQQNEFRPHSTRSQGRLTGQVWPKSRMLFAVVSKMSKEGLLSQNQRGILKDLILDYDSELISHLSEYDRLGDKEKLYNGFLEVANMQAKS